MAYRHLSILPPVLYDLTPRELQNLLNGRMAQLKDERYRMAVGAMMHRMAMNKKKLEMRDLIGKRRGSSVTKVSGLEEKKAVLADLENRLGRPT